MHQIVPVMAALCGFAAPGAADSAAPAQASDWNTIVAATSGNELVVLDPAGNVVTRHQLDAPDAIAPVVAVVDGRVALAQNATESVVVIGLDDGAIETYPIPENAVVRPVAESDTLLFAAPTQGGAGSVIDLDRRITLSVDALWEPGDDRPRLFNPPVVDSASDVIAVSETAARQTALISLDDATVTVVDGFVIGLVGDTFVTVSGDRDSQTLTYYASDGTVRDSFEAAPGIERVVVTDGTIVGASADGTIRRISEESPTGETIGTIEIGDDEFLGLVPIGDGSQVLAVTESAAHVVPLGGGEIRAVADLEQPSRAFVGFTAATRCIHVGNGVVDITSGELLAPGSGLRSTDGCTYVVMLDGSGTEQVVRDRVAIDLAGGLRVQSIAPDGSHVIVRDIESESYHLVDLDQPDEVGPGLDIGDADHAVFSFVQR